MREEEEQIDLMQADAVCKAGSGKVSKHNVFINFIHGLQANNWDSGFDMKKIIHGNRKGECR